MDQEKLFFEANTAIKDDLASLPFVRHYMQEESFTSHGNEALRVDLPYNHLINQIVSELGIVNKQIAANSKLTTSLLENGRDIYLKKRQYFEEFRNEYPIIRDALDRMDPRFRFVFQYSAMALSNLILKLSINMAKISIIIVTRFLTPSYLNIFTVALLFEKYLELQLVKNKKFTSLEDHRHFLKQFPKISLIKISKKRNPYDIEFIQRSQTFFNQNSFSNKNLTKTNQTDVHNIQLLEFFEQEAEDIMATKKDTRRYPRFDSFNLSKMGLKTPFSFELYLLISEIAVAKMIDFKPDIIIYIEDFDCDEVSIDPKVRGLIINHLSSKVQNKIYVFKEFGITEQMKLNWLQETGQPYVPQFTQQFVKKISDTIETNDDVSSNFISECDKHEQRKISIERYMNQNMQITYDLFKQLQDYLKIQYRKNTIFAVTKVKESDLVLAERLKVLHGNMLEDLTYLSLALIQKSNFDAILKEFRNYIFPVNFLERVIWWIRNELQIIENEKISFDFGDQYKYKIEKLKGMKSLTLNSMSVSQRKSIPFYNFLTKREEQFVAMENQVLRPIKIEKDDSFYVCYIENFIILFVFGGDYYTLYRKHFKEGCFNLVHVGIYQGDHVNLAKKHSTFVANSKYLYKAFGEAKDPLLNNQSQIFRFSIENPMKLEFSKWERVGSLQQKSMDLAKEKGSYCIPINSADKAPSKKPPKIPIEFKRHGFGFSYDTIQKERSVSITLFGGGFNFKIQNQEKINRYLYIIKDNSDEIFKLGKTNSELVNEGENMRNKTIIYPFVYGIPLSLSPTTLTVINTNGYLDNINHFKKLFLTKLRVGPLNSPNNSLNSIGIISQNKLIYNLQSPEIAVANKNTILTYIMHSYNKINRFQNKVALYNSDNEIVLLEALEETATEHFDVIRAMPLNSHEMSENEQTLSINFGSKRMILKQQ